MNSNLKEKTILTPNQAVSFSHAAFLEYRHSNVQVRAKFLRRIAHEIELVSNDLIETAVSETHLGKSRLEQEFKRTLFQLRSYADACEQGGWMDIRIETKNKNNQADLRKMMIPLGPVIVFGASNFPFAYSTAGGDTACAFAAGCSVIVKAHPAHLKTSGKVADAIKAAIVDQHLPSHIFMHIEDSGFDAGKELVQHPLTSAVGFTGSLEGGRALFDLAGQRDQPIPVFAEMGSVNPVFILPEKLKHSARETAELLANSITQSAGQFCTNPGILIAIENEALTNFENFLAEKIRSTRPEEMLHPGISKNYLEKLNQRLSDSSVSKIAESDYESAFAGIPTIAGVSADDFMKNPSLQNEVFGPFSMLVKCQDQMEMLAVAKFLKGQLTTTIIATEDEIKTNTDLVSELQLICGRMIFNGVPTGVTVSLAMHHGGPYPATTDSRFTAVGADGIKRFARPICYQNWTNDILPEALQNDNPLKLLRTVNGKTFSDPLAS